MLIQLTIIYAEDELMDVMNDEDDNYDDDYVTDHH